MKPEYLTRQEVADKLRVSTRTVERWEKLGKIKASQISGAKRYKASDIDK